LDGAVFDRLVLAGRVGEYLSGAACLVFGPSVDAHADEAREGWIAHLLPVANLFGVKALVVVLRCQTHCGVIGLEGLKDDFSRAVCATGAAGDLCEQLKGAFGGAEIWEGQALIGKGYTDQGDTGDVVSLGDHLRAYEHVNLAAPQPIEDLLDPVSRRRVAIEPRDAGFRETLFDGFLQLLRADAKSFVLRASARCAWNGYGTMKIAVVTSKRALPAMFGQGDTARWALRHHTTGRAAQAWRKASPI
jgi:hypothetical protein